MKLVKRIGSMLNNVKFQTKIILAFCMVYIVSLVIYFMLLSILNTVQDNEVSKAGLIVILILVSCVAALLTVLLSGLITTRLSELARKISKVGNGDLNIELYDDCKDEIGQISYNICRMLEGLNNNMHLKREKLCRMFLEGNAITQDIKDAHEMFGMELESNIYQVVLLSFQTDAGINESKLSNFIFSHCDSTFIEIILRPSLVCIISSCPEDTTYTRIENLISIFKEDSQLLNVKAFFGSCYSELSLIKKSYYEAMELIRYHQQDSRQEIFKYENITYSKNNLQYPHDIEDGLAQSLEEGNLYDCITYADNAKAYFDRHNCKTYYVSFFLNSIFQKLYKCMIDVGIHPDMIYGESWHTSLEWHNNDFDMSAAFDTLKSHIAMFINKINDMNKNKSGNYSGTINKALRILKDEYVNPLLCVSLISEKLFLHETYFSYLFKKEVGMGFTEYVNKLRIAEAKELLEKTDLMIKDISHTIGFEGPHYFGVAFKNIVGVTPSQYRSREKINK